MRPIDADSLMEKLNGIWDCNDMTFAPVDGCCIDADCKSCRWRETIEYVKRLLCTGRVMRRRRCRND